MRSPNFIRKKKKNKKTKQNKKQKQKLIDMLFYYDKLSNLIILC